MKYRVAILRDELPETAERWKAACENKEIEFTIVDLLRNDWLDEIRSFRPNFCVCRPPADLQLKKRIFEQKIFFLERQGEYPVYPGSHEVFVYEDKAALSWFLAANDIPHVRTFVSLDRGEAQGFLDSCRFPIVAKTLIGATGSGVKVLADRREALNYIQLAFSSGLQRRYGPNRRTGNLRGWAAKALHSPSYLVKRIRQYNRVSGDRQKGIVLFQDFVEHDFEWRCVRIGESYFAYKKLVIGGMASGSKQFEFGPAPTEVLDFTRDLCVRHRFQFMAVDMFFKEGRILVNELQTLCGHKSSAICVVDGKPGRYKFTGGVWLFEEGLFNSNESYDLRLSTAVELYNNREK